MKALILNSGLGNRMGVLTSEHPKCMTEISATETILSRQLRLIAEAGIKDVVMTTGYYSDVLERYCKSLALPLCYTFAVNPLYDRTNYIYSIWCARDFLHDDDVLLMHGDLVFENTVFDDVLAFRGSCVTVSSTAPLPEKDFKAVLKDGFVSKVGVEFFDAAVAAQPLYKLSKEDWAAWLQRIGEFCAAGKTGVYAENALNEVSEACKLQPLDVRGRLCAEVDNPQDLEAVYARLHEVENRTVYMCFSTDIIHSGHVAIIHKAQRLGRLVVGVLSDEATASYKRFPMIPFQERVSLMASMAGVYKVVEQKTLSYRDNLLSLRPDFVVHGDDWRERRLSL